MGHHCGCFVCYECKTLSSSHLNGVLDTGYVQLCPDCAKYGIMRQEETGESEVEDETGESEVEEENKETENEANNETEGDDQEIEEPESEIKQTTKKRKLFDDLLKTKFE